MISKNFLLGRRKIKKQLIYIVIFGLFYYISYSLEISIEKWNAPMSINHLNSIADDYAPIYNIYDSLLYFSSSRLGSTYFYISKYNGNVFEQGVLSKSAINLTAKHQNYISFLSPTLAYFTSFKSTNNYPTLSIYKSYFVKNNWSLGIIDDTLNIGQSNCQITFSPDRQTAIFVSNKGNNNTEDTDLWMIHKSNDGDWNIPIKLNEINTTSREITPFLKSSDSLYFASDGFGGPGGFDLYLSIRVDGIWQRPTPLFDLNTEFNESDICFLPDNSMIFASDRPGGAGGLDLYHTFITHNNEDIKITQKPELSILTQSSLIQAEKIVNTSVLPFPTIFPEAAIEYNKNNKFYEYIYQSIVILAHRLEDNPAAMIQISSSKFNSFFENIFTANNIGADRYHFLPESNKYISIKSNIQSILEYIVIEKAYVNLKPPAIDIKISNNNSTKLKDFQVYLDINKDISNIDIHSDSLPLRFIYDIEPFANKIYNSDSISILLKYSYSSYDDSICKVLNIVKSETKSSIKSINNNKYIDFDIYMPNEIDINSFLSNNEKLLDLIKQETDVCAKIIVLYYSKESKNKADRLIANIIKGKKNIEFNLSPLADFVLEDEPQSFLKLRIEKF